MWGSRQLGRACAAGLLLGLVAVRVSGLDGEKFEYQAEVGSLMKLITHYMYTNRDIVVRELLSNASDALDKMRMRALEDRSLLKDNPELKIMVAVDEEKKLISFEDSGIGMDKEELVKYLGTVAKSGTAEILSKLKDRKSDADSLIGQFGVGFYASYLVADRVTVISKSCQAGKDGKQWIWQSSADSQTFTVKEDTVGPFMSRGTRVILHLKEDAEEYLQQDKLQGLIKNFAQFYPFPIYLTMNVSETRPKSKAEKDKDKDLDKDADKDKDTDKDKDKDEIKFEPVKNDDSEKDSGKDDSEKETETITVKKDVLMNPSKPIWRRDPKEIKKEEYIEFYKSYYNEHSEPLTWVHFKGEGDVQFWGLYFIPKRPLFNMFAARGDREELLKSVSLYVRRVFTKKEQLFSESLSSIIRGLVDSDELPLNVSRETLQNSALIEQIRRKSTNKILDRLAEMQEEDPKAFDSFYQSFSSSLKLEIVHSEQHRKRLSKLLRFATTKTAEGESKSLQDYVGGMGEKQKFIYFLAGSELSELRKSPLVEGLVARNTEVILATDAVDEYCLQAIGSFEKVDFKNVAKEKAVDDEVTKELKDQFKPLTDWLKDEVLKEDVSEVILSSRLTNSSCAVVASSYGFSGHMEAVMRAQSGSSASDPMLKFMEMQKRVLEINPLHPTIKRLLTMASSEGGKAEAKSIVKTLYDAALVRSGYSLRNSDNFMAGIDRLILGFLGKTESAGEPNAASSDAKEAAHDEL